jgi:lysophospholipase L1-like esterase
MNMGQIGFASEQVKVLVQEVLDKGEPDLLVVYSGHNEYLDVKARLELEKAGVKLPAVAPGDWLERHSAAARFLRGLRPARNAKKKVSDNLLGDYLGNHLSEQQIQARYEKNLVEIARAAKARRTPLIFCTLLANPLPTAFDSYFFDERWSESEKHQVSQAIGWARLQRWDKAEEAVQGMIASAPQLKLLRIFEADGVRGLDALSPAARRYLADAAPAVIRAITGSSLIRSRDYYVLAVAYRVAGDRAGLAATLQRLDEDLRLRTGGDTKRVIRLLRAQFDDAATFHRVFRELWASDTALITARPITNETIRAVAAREGVALADVEQKLSDWLDSAPDHYLLDYCHLNIEGAFAVAQLIFDTARKNRMLPPPERNVDFRATMLAPELTYLRTTGHDFLERDKYLGLNFRVCFVYAPPFPNYVELSRWLEEDARNEHDRRVVDALVQNFHYYQGH